MHGVAADACAFDGTGVRGEDKIVAAEIEGAGGKGVERHEVPMDAGRAWKVLQEGGVQLSVAERGWDGFRRGQHGEEIGLREERGDALGDALTAAPCDEPVVKDCNTHQKLRTLIERAVGRKDGRVQVRRSVPVCGDYRTPV